MIDVKVEKSFIELANKLSTELTARGVQAVNGNVLIAKVNIEREGKTAGGIIIKQDDLDNTRVNLAKVIQLPAEETAETLGFDVGDYLVFNMNVALPEYPPVVKLLSGVDVPENMVKRIKDNEPCFIIPRAVIEGGE